MTPDELARFHALPDVNPYRERHLPAPEDYLPDVVADDEVPWTGGWYLDATGVWRPRAARPKDKT